MHRIIIGTAILTALAGVALTLFLTNASSQMGFTRKAMLENIAGNVILPRHAALVEAAARFEASAQQFADEPSQGTLDRAQADWTDAIVAWAGIEPFGFGPVEIMVLHNQINELTIDPDLIDSYLRSGDIRAEILEAQGPSVKGLSVAEIILFHPDGDGAVLDAIEARPELRPYLAALAQNIHARSRDLHDFWSAEGQDYAATFAAADGTGGSTKDSINMLVNEMITIMEETTALKLAPAIYITPMVLGFRDSDADLPHGQLSGTMAPRIRSTVRSVEAAFTGGDGLGLDDYLVFLGLDDVAELVRLRLDEAIEALDTIEDPLRETSDSQLQEVLAAYETQKALLVAIGVDAANQLGITVTLRDADAD